MNVQAYIASGDLECYYFGLLDDEKVAEVRTLSQVYPEIREEFKEIEHTMEQFAKMQAIAPNPQLKDRIFASLNFEGDTLDINNLPPTNKYSDHKAWLKAVEHLIPAEPLDDFFAELLQQNEQIAQTLVVTRLNVPEEVHEVVSESFFILEGTCTCTVGRDVFTLNAGDHLSIPLHTNHDIRIDSPYVIAILQHQFA